MNMHRLSFLIAVIFFLSSCATNPVTGKKELNFLSEEQEIEMGRTYDPQIIASMGLYPDQAMQEFIEQRGKEMAAISHRSHLEFHFRILDSPVVNAFAVPGGYVYFTRGIMAHFNNEAEFAGVLGHEIGHVTARHSAKQYTNQVLAQVGLIAGIIIKPELVQFADLAQSGLSILFLKFSRDNESQSDQLGVEYSTKVGYDAHQMANFFRTIERLQEESGADQIPNFLSTHPDPANRFENVHQYANEWQAKFPDKSFEIDRGDYLDMIDGIVFGEDPRQGFVEDNTFYHPELKFMFPVPAGWTVNNTPIQVQIASPDGNAIMVFSLAEEETLTAAADAAIAKNGFRVISRENTRVNGFEAIKLVSEIPNEQDPNASLRVMTYLIEDGEYIYKFHGVAVKGNYGPFASTFAHTMTGYKRLTDPDKLNRQPDRLHIRTVSRTQTLQSALDEMNVSPEEFDTHAILNGELLSDMIASGSKIKVVGK